MLNRKYPKTNEKRIVITLCRLLHRELKKAAVFADTPIHAFTDALIKEALTNFYRKKRVEDSFDPSQFL